jgi:hypothetical protein
VRRIGWFRCGHLIALNSTQAIVFSDGFRKKSPALRVSWLIATEPRDVKAATFVSDYPL